MWRIGNAVSLHTPKQVRQICANRPESRVWRGLSDPLLGTITDDSLRHGLPQFNRNKHLGDHP